MEGILLGPNENVGEASTLRAEARGRSRSAHRSRGLIPRGSANDGIDHELVVGDVRVITQTDLVSVTHATDEYGGLGIPGGSEPGFLDRACDDDLDNDGNGHIDYAGARFDADCAGDPSGSEASPSAWGLGAGGWGSRSLRCFGCWRAGGAPTGEDATGPRQQERLPERLGPGAGICSAHPLT
jgi:hypothetical protein